ncbi:hypothetical protein ZEAMMB73_Zm00001d042773 [Zea mays]|uniref:Uncharacterized protein n=1 Tax=Zea mays TaxID=4577 RepID=A0A1D6N6M8_MAIZE|nr:hypothetical protein ZEAMMB73_Zm00001d042773 [Zea mays]
MPFARRYALRAARLYPTSPRAPVVATAANVLLADASSHHAALLLPEPDDPDASPLSVSELCRHFKSLIKSLRVGLDATTAAAYPSVAAAAEEALDRATKAYEALTAPAPGTFWTACAGCRLLHEFERKLYRELRSCLDLTGPRDYSSPEEMVQRLTSASTVLRRVLDNPALQDCQENNGFGDMMDEDVISNISIFLEIELSFCDPRRIADLLMCLALRLLLQPSWVRQVLEKKAREWCASKGDIPYFETSAKEDHNVDTAFLCIARLALEHEHDQDIYFKTVAEQVPDTEQTSRCAC